MPASPITARQPKAEEVPKITAPLLLHYAGLDERINAGIPAYEAALKQAGKTYEIYVYEGANHAFNNDTAARYNKAAADLAWERTLGFFRKYVTQLPASGRAASLRNPVASSRARRNRRGSPAA